VTEVKTTLWMAWTGSKEALGRFRRGRFVRGIGMLLLLAFFFSPIGQAIVGAALLLGVIIDAFSSDDVAPHRPSDDYYRRTHFRDDVEAAYGGVAPPGGRSH
jgi:hypothetical protein